MNKNLMGEEPEKALTIYLIRHGETTLNAENRLRGWSNPPLNPAGKEDARIVGEAMKDVELSAMYVSDLKRAQQTAQQLKAARRVDTHFLRPINWGDFNGKLLSEVGPKMEHIQKIWQKNPRFPAPNGESWQSFQDRQIIVRDAVLKEKLGNSVAVVAHLRNCIWWMAMAVNNAPLKGKELNMLNRVTQEPAVISVLKYSKKGGFMLMAENREKPLE